MKILLSAAAAAIAFGFQSSPALAEGDATTCAISTLKGTYAWGGVGTDFGFPYSTSGMESYDGEGHIAYTQLWSEGGVTYVFNGTGTISIAANCIATAIYDGGAPWTYFVAADGRGYYENNNGNRGLVSGGFVDRISPALLVSPPAEPNEDSNGHCTLETLRGSYAVAYQGTVNGNPFASSGMESYDGLGHLKYVQFWDAGRGSYVYHGTGTVTITPNCIATVIYDGGGKPWTFFVAADGARYYWNNNTDAGPVAGGHVDRISTAFLLN